MRRGITPVIAIALLLGMTVTASGGAYAWITQTTEQAQDEASQGLRTALTVKEVRCGGQQALVALTNTGDREVAATDVQAVLYRGDELLTTADLSLSDRAFTGPGGFDRVRINFSEPFEAGYRHRLDLRFRDAGYTVETECAPSEGTLAVAWDRENDGDTLVAFENRMTEDTNTMGEWSEDPNHIRWSEAGTGGDTLKYHHDIPYPNTGNVTLDLYFVGVSYESSGVAFWVEDAAGNAYLPSNGTNTTCDEDGETPDPFSCVQDEDGTFTWDGNFSVTAGREIDRFYIASDHNDCCFDGGDSSDLYAFRLWVR